MFFKINNVQLAKIHEVVIFINYLKNQIGNLHLEMGINFKNHHFETEEWFNQQKIRQS